MQYFSNRVAKLETLLNFSKSYSYHRLSESPRGLPAGTPPPGKHAYLVRSESKLNPEASRHFSNSLIINPFTETPDGRGFSF